MDFGSAVVDISSDEEPDEFGVNKTLDETYYLLRQWPNDIEEVDTNDFVNEYLHYMENCGSLKARSIVSQNYLDDDCIVLDSDPDKPDFVNDTERNGGNGTDDLCIVGQKGQVACRDFPHSRHLCANFSFNTTSHEKHCKLCHCYVCDYPAPCVYWGNGASLSDHCHATDKKEAWKSQRKLFKKIITKTPSPHLQALVPLPIQNPRSFLHQVPARQPVQPPNATPSRPCFAPIRNAAYLPSQRPYQNTINPAQRSDADSSALAHSIVQAHSKLRRVGTPGYGLTSSGVNRASQTSFNPNQMNVSVPHRPVSPIVTLQAPQNVATAASDTRKWQDIVAGLAAELGVSDYVTPPYYSSPSPRIQSQYNNSNQGNRPYHASPSPLIQSQDNGSSQRMAVQTNVGRAVNLSNSLDGTAGQNVNMGTSCVDGRWNGPQEVDSALLLYET